MATFKGLVSLAKKYNYDSNHNLRYLALAKIIKHYSINELLVLGCGKGILEYILPDEVRCTSIDINQDEIKIAKEINLGKKNRSFIVKDMLKWIRNSEKKYRAILISEVLEHLEDDREIVKFAHRIIEPDKGLFLLTVPNISRFVNKIYPLIRRKSKFMHEQHLREYTVREIHRLLSFCEFKVIHTKYVYFRFPRENLLRKVIPINSQLRELILKIRPSWADYIIVVSLSSQNGGQTHDR